jgi:hypothetical protein
MMRGEQCRFFRFRQSFRLLPEGARYAFEQGLPAGAGTQAGHYIPTSTS